MSFGKIYCSTWWGDYRNIQRSIIDKPDCILPDPLQYYITRVENAGGTVDAKECVANLMIDRDWVPYSYIQRVELAGGTIENKDCFIELMN